MNSVLGDVNSDVILNKNLWKFCVFHKTHTCNCELWRYNVIAGTMFWLLFELKGKRMTYKLRRELWYNIAQVRTYCHAFSFIFCRIYSAENKRSSNDKTYLNTKQNFVNNFYWLSLYKCDGLPSLLKRKAENSVKVVRANYAWTIIFSSLVIDF